MSSRMELSVLPNGMDFDSSLNQSLNIKRILSLCEILYVHITCFSVAFSELLAVRHPQTLWLLRRPFFVHFFQDDFQFWGGAALEWHFLAAMKIRNSQTCSVCRQSWYFRGFRREHKSLIEMWSNGVATTHLARRRQSRCTWNGVGFTINLSNKYAALLGHSFGWAWSFTNDLYVRISRDRHIDRTAWRRFGASIRNGFRFSFRSYR